MAVRWPGVLRFLFLILLLAPSAWAQAHTAYDAEIANYPVDAAACAAMRKGGTNVAVIYPRAIGGIGGGNTRIIGYIMPDTPIFRFYAIHAAQLYKNPRTFAQSMRCIFARSGTVEQVSFPNLPNGKYIFLIRDDTNVKYQVETGTGMAVDSLGGIVDVPFEKENQEASSTTFDFSRGSVVDGKLKIERFTRVMSRLAVQGDLP